MGQITKRLTGDQDHEYWDSTTAASYFTAVTSTGRTMTLKQIGSAGPYHFNKIVVTKTLTTNAEPSATPQVLLQASGDTTYRLALYNSGKLEWGEGGTSGRDVNLYRSASGILKFSGSALERRSRLCRKLLNRI